MTYNNIRINTRELDNVFSIKSFTLYITDLGLCVLSQISHSLVVILELGSVSEVQYKEIMIIGDE